MIRSEREMGRDPMHAGLTARSATGVASETEPGLALVAAWRSTACPSCGQHPRGIAPQDAVAVAGRLQRRCGRLLDHGEDRSQACRAAMRVSDVLSVADSRLRQLFGEESQEPEPGPVVAAGSAAARPPPPAGLATLTEVIKQLALTIGGATAEDWKRSRPDDGITAGEVVWLALHDATHQVTDAELALDRALTTDRALPAADGPPDPRSKLRLL